MKQINAVFQQVDAALRKNQADEARRYADLFVLQALTSQEREGIIDTLEHALDEARRRRRRASTIITRPPREDFSDGPPC